MTALRSALSHAFAAAFAAISCISCARHGPTPAPVDAGPRPDAAPAPSAREGEAGSTPEGDAGSPPEVLGGYPWQMDLDDVAEDGGARRPKLGVLSVPLGAREPRPIMLALHGGSDRPEWACSAWRGVVNAYPFLVCPRGAGGNEGALGWIGLGDTKTRIARAIAATKKIFGRWVRDDVPIVIVGFSMGGTQTALLAQSEPQVYRRIALVESSYNLEPALAFARPWAAGGGERALFGCTTSGCEAPYRKAAANVAAQRRPARLNVAGTRDHGMWADVVRSLRRDWPWLVEDTPGWETYEKPVEEGELPGTTLKLEGSER
ncbi:MAG: hypothetical protein JST00_25565 [Deltaproteobacteria bacterium]|nr:hypothetical protein [Deltaproteobacteria bacterium]